MKNYGLTLVSFLGGAIVGAAVAMLVTPKSGSAMREYLREFVDEELSKVGNKCKCSEEHNIYDMPHSKS